MIAPRPASLWRRLKPECLARVLLTLWPQPERLGLRPPAVWLALPERLVLQVPPVLPERLVLRVWLALPELRVLRVPPER
jgi:hypothetical protein